MKKYEGTVSKFPPPREFRPNVFLYSFQLEGNNKWFRTGEEKPNIEEGKTYRFVEMDNNKVDVHSIEEIDESEVSTGTKSPSSTGASGESTGTTKGIPTTRIVTKDDYWRNREERDVKNQQHIRYGYARSDATRIICAALDNDFIPIASNVKGGKEVKFELLMDLVEKVTQEFLEKQEKHVE